MYRNQAGTARSGLSLRLCVCSMFMCSVVTSAETVGPHNVAITNGSTATFNCIIDAPLSDVCWTHETVSSELFNHLHDEGGLTHSCDDDKCNITFDNATSVYTLAINSVQHYDAGFYACRICEKADEKEAQLIVLQTGE